MPLKSLQLDTIRIDGNCQPPGRLGEDEVADYAEQMKDGRWDFDRAVEPITVFEDGGDRWLAHGFHRYHAARRAGLATVECLVRSGTLAEAQKFAASCNKMSSRRRSNADKRWQVETILRLEPTWSDRLIAEHVGVSHPFVGSCRPQVETVTTSTRTGSDGKTYKIKQRGAKYHNPNPVSSGPPPAPPMEAPCSQQESSSSRSSQHQASGASSEPVSSGSPSDPATEAINRGSEINRLALDVFAIKRRLGELKKDPISACLNFNAIETALTNAAQFIKHGVPHAPCPYAPNCAAGRCTACKGRGWLNERDYAEAQRMLEETN